MENDFFKPTHPTKVWKIPYFFFFFLKPSLIENHSCEYLIKKYFLRIGSIFQYLKKCMYTCLNMYLCKNICMYMFVYSHDTINLIVMKPI